MSMHIKRREPVPPTENLPEIANENLDQIEQSLANLVQAIMGCRKQEQIAEIAEIEKRLLNIQKNTSQSVINCCRALTVSLERRYSPDGRSK